MLQIGVTIHHGQVEFLPKLRGIRTFSTLNWANVGLLQTDDSILSGSGCRTSPSAGGIRLGSRQGGPAASVGKGLRSWRPRPQICLAAGQPVLCRPTALQWPSGILPASIFCSWPVSDRICVLFCRIGQLMAGMRDLFPDNAHRCLQVLPALVQQVNVGGIFDVSRRHRCIQNQLPTVLFLAVFLLFGRIGVYFPFAAGTGGSFPSSVSSFQSTFRCFSGHFPVQTYSLIFATSSTGNRLRKCTIIDGSNNGSG